jgi:hypothetical protein
MRHRRWVLLLAAVLVAVVPAGLLSLRAASRHPSFRSSVADRLVPPGVGRATVGEIEFGLSSLRMSDVRIEFADGGFVEVPQATLRLSPRRLVTSGFRLARSFGDVVVTRPRAVLVLGARKAGEGAEPTRLARLFDGMPDRVTVSGASVTVVDRGAGWSVSVRSLDVAGARGADGRFQAEAGGACLGPRGALEGRLAWDRRSRTLSAAARVEGADLAEGCPVPGDAPVRPVRGRADASLDLAVRDGSPARWLLSFVLDECELELPGLGETLGSVAAAGTYDGARLRLRSASGAWRESVLGATGAVSLADGTFDSLRVSAASLPVAALASHAFPDSALPAIEGVVDAEVVLSGAFSDPTALVTLSDADVSVASVAFADCEGRGTVGRDSVGVERLVGRAAGGSFRVAGSASRGSGAACWALDASGEAIDIDLAAAGTLVGPRLGGRVSLAPFDLGGTTELPELDATLRWSDLVAGRARLGAGEGSVLLGGGDLAADLRSSDGTCSVAGRVTDVPGRAGVDAEVVLSAFPADSAFGLSGASLAPRSVTGRVSLLGAPDALSVDGELTLAGGDLEGTFGIMGGLTGGPGQRRLNASLASTDAAYRGVAVPLSVDLLLDRESLDVTRVEVADALSGSARLELLGNRRIDGAVTATEVVLADVLRSVTGSSTGGAVSGRLSASATIGGTLSEPVVAVSARAESLRLGSVAGLGAVAEGEVRGTRVSIRSAELSDDGGAFLTASGELDLRGDVSVSARGSGVPGRLLGGSEDTRFGVTLGIGGTRADPTLDAVVESSGGEFLGVPFDRLLARVTGAEGVARVEPLALERSGSYRVTASALVPYAAVRHGSTAEGSLTVEVDGDPVALLAGATKAVASEGGEGTMAVHLVGNRDGVSVARGELEVAAARVRPSAVFDELTGVSASLVVVDGAVVSGAVEGLVDGRRLRAESVRGATAGGRELPPLRALGIDLGVVALSTDPEGVRLHVPGLVQPDHVGVAAARGRDGGPAFLVAGPGDHPFLWGEIELSDMRFTYPFLGGSIGVGTRFLSDAEWDVRLVAGRNLWYEREDSTLRVERGGALDLVGVPSEHALCVAGRVAATAGSVTYMGEEFDVETAIVDFPAFCEPPRFTVEASARVEDGTRINLAMDSTEGDLMLAGPGVTLDESAIVLRSDAPEDDTQEKIISKLQYGVSYDVLRGDEQASLERKQALDAVGSQIGGRIARPLLSPIEARVRRALRLDLVRIQVDFVGHFLAQLDEWRAHEGRAEYVPFLAESRVSLGKYVTRDWLLSYVGRAEAFEQDIGYQRLGLRHEIGVEYEVSPHTSVSLRAVYDPALSEWDRGVSIENRFQF